MVELARLAGKPVFFSLAEVPQIADLPRSGETTAPGRADKPAVENAAT
jgi:hypothetical protein